jgi:transcriptional regulator
MYLPTQFDTPEHASTIMREHPFASLVSVDDDGFPFVTHLPLSLHEEGDSPLKLLGHCARANPHVRFLQTRPEALITFMGPQAYMSPRVYADLQKVPTWSYLAVHVKVQARLLDAETTKDALLKQLIAEHEPAYADQWRGLPETYTHAMLKGIVAFELDIVSIQTKVKINQHRPESHQAMYDLYQQGGEQEQALAQWMTRLGLITP